ncbi:MAG: carbohydrate binding family 9 domain-containing protein, partial [Candidatus Zixiibacteriota bacterium]
MRRCTVFITLAGVLIAGAVAAQDEFKPQFQPTMVVQRTPGPIEIDGELYDSGWRNASRVSNFAERQPGDQTKPPVETEVIVRYDRNRLYIAFICHDDPNYIRATLCDRDRYSGDDNIVVAIDTYGEAEWTYEFFVNPYGVQGDRLWTRSGGEDASFDLVWDAAAKITDSGYQVEMAVPFSSLRFPNEPVQTWKIDFWRNHPRESHRQYSWAANDRDNPCWVCQFGTIRGIADVQPGKGIEILPSVVAYQTGALSGDGSTEAPFDFTNNDPDTEISIGGKYSISSDITTEATYNPDFSQIEADPLQIDVNTTFALSYPERRPFFQEGTDLFRTWLPLVYTRSINDPQFAAKTTARIGRTSLAYLVAHDENTPIILPFEESSAMRSTGRSTSNILRLRWGYGSESYIGMLLTDRRLDGGGSGTVLSADGEQRLSRNFRVQWQLVAGYTDESNDSMITYNPYDTLFNSRKFYKDHTAGYDGESYWGHMVTLNLEERSRNFNFDISYIEFSPTFRADVGYMPRNNQRETNLYAAYTSYINNDIFDQITMFSQAGSIWNFDRNLKEQWVTLNADIMLKGQTNIHPQILRGVERFHDSWFDNIWSVHFCAHSKFSDILGASTGINYGNRIVRFENPVMGRETSMHGSLELKPVDRLTIEPMIEYVKSDNINDGEELFEVYITSTRLNYQITRELSLRVLFQYDDYYKTVDFDPLLTYRLNAFSLFYIGSAYDYEEYNNIGPDGTGSANK